MSDERTLEILQAFEDDVRDLCLKYALKLHDAGAIRIHRGWVASEEIRDIARDASSAAVRSVVGCDWGAFSDEVLWLYGPKREVQPIAAE